MSLQQYAPGKFRVVIYAGTKDNGKPRQLTRKVGEGITEREAKRLAPAIEADLRSQVEEEQSRSGTVSELADDWLALKARIGRSQITLDGYRNWADIITARFGHLQVDEISGQRIDQWYDELHQGGASASKVLHIHAVLRGMLRQAVKWGRVTFAATDRATPPAAVKPKLAVPTPQALAAAIGQIPESDFRRMIEFAALTGLRPGELCGLAWGDVEGGVMTVQRAVKQPQHGNWFYGPLKTNRERKMGLPATAQIVLAEQLAWLAGQIGVDAVTPETPIFPHLDFDATGKRPHLPSWLGTTWRNLRDEIGLPGTTPHKLRHLNATTMLQARISSRTAADRLGHSKPSITTDIYGHGNAEGDDLALRVLEDKIGAVLRPPPAIEAEAS